MVYYLTPFLLQGSLMFLDEFYFHRKRGLPKWELIGHPLDTLSVLICYLFLLLRTPTTFDLNVYIALCAVSCLLVTKDEFVHTQVCNANENWLHSLLFILHPVTLFCAGIIWLEQINLVFIKLQALVILSFLIYQIIYWSFFAKNKQRNL